MSTTVGRLVRAELKLMTRDPLVLTFVFAFPIVTMLIIGGAFGTSPDPAFDGTNPSHWYVASYLTVVIAATGLVMLPVHLASYRERGVLRRFAAAGFPRWSGACAGGSSRVSGERPWGRTTAPRLGAPSRDSSAALPPTPSRSSPSHRAALRAALTSDTPK